MTSSVASAGNHPDPRAFDGDLDRMLAVLLRAKGLGAPWLKATEISKILRDDFGIGVHWKTVETVLSEDKKIAARRKRNRSWEFTILGPGEERITEAGSPIIVIDPAAAVPAVVNFHKVLGGLKGPIRICDPYFDAATVEHLDACPVG